MKPHLLLNNPRGEERKFDASRNITSPETEPPIPQAYRPQKNKLQSSLLSFQNKRESRLKARSLELPAHIEYVRIDFFVVFNNNDSVYKTQDRFIKDFGLYPVAYSNFNQTVCFAITDENKFRDFAKLLGLFINSRDNISPRGTPYAIMTLIHDFEFLASDKILLGRPEESVILSLVKSNENINSQFNQIYVSLINHIKSLSSNGREVEVHTDGESTIQINNVTKEEVSLIADNFDIIYKIQSLRSATIRPDKYNVPQLAWNLKLQPPTKEVIIGVLDTGVRVVTPLEKLIINYDLDITNNSKPNPLFAVHPHGTFVASLAAIGTSIFDTTKTEFVSDAFILPIKIIESGLGQFKVYELIEAIKNANSKGVRIFNLSVVGPCKAYNEEVSEFAYLLDKIAYEKDILIFIATGNLEEEAIEEMQLELAIGEHEDFHKYPFHFYNPSKQSNSHVCEAINLCSPAESYNNITVGAIADNLIAGQPTGITPLKELPAYYTRKHYIDYNKNINGTDFKRSQINYNINKPDIVMPGGDLLDENPRMQVLGFGDQGNDFYRREAGTSLACPLAANLAARIISLYPSLNMQSVKALILNSCTRPLDAGFLEDLVTSLKNEISKKKYRKAFTRLNRKEKMSINEKISEEALYQKLVGFGVPNETEALYSNSKSVSIVIQDSVSINSHKAINITIPEYLLDYSKKTPILRIKATLCFKFPPVWNNQLGYNPIHISFNFIKSLVKDNPGETARIISDRDHTFFTQASRGITDPKKKLKAKNEALGIKKHIQSWSEDFFPSSVKPFSNTQQLTLNISAEELEKVDNQISLVVRSTHRRDLDAATQNMLKSKTHQFSIAINISEKENDELSEFDLYYELIEVNNLETLADLTLDTEQDLEAEI